MKLSAEYLLTLQNRIDMVGNNLANTITPGFKEQLLSLEEGYDAQDRSHTVAFYGGTMPGSGNPVLTPNLYAGRRVDFSQGSLVDSGNPWDMAIMGEGFFQVRTPNGQLGYTRAGMFSPDGNGNLVNNEGMLLEPRISLPSNAFNVSVREDGSIRGLLRPELDENGEEIENEDFFSDDDSDFFGEDIGEEGEGDQTILFGKVALYKFSNPDGLEQMGNNIFLPTQASGEAQEGVPGSEGFGNLKSRMLERSNTNVVLAMTNLIQGQRAYQIEVRQTRNQDEMMAQAIAMRG